MDDELFFHDIGSGLPILIIHGREMNGRVDELDFEPIFSKVPDLRRMYIDLPGMGRSHANGIKNLDDIYNQLAHFIDIKLGMSRFLLIGSSCGAYVARALAVKYRDQINGLLLRVPVVEPHRSKRDLDPFAPIVCNEQVVSADDKSTFGNTLVQTMDYVKALKAKFHAVYLPATKVADSETLDPLQADPVRYSLSVPLYDQRAQLLAPTLIVCGRHDATVGYRDAVRLLEVYPRSTFTVHDRGEHYLPLDERDLFNALVTDWVTRVREWRDAQTKEA